MSDKKIKSPQIRFTGFTDAWEHRKLGDEFKKVNERNDGSFGKEHWISVAKMYFQDPEKVQSNNIDTRTYVMREGDIAFEGHPNAEFKFGRFVANDIGAGVVSELFPIYRHKNEYDNNYWKHAIQIERIMAPIFTKSITSSGNSSNKLDEKHFLRQSIFVPKIEEQQKISHLFKELDNFIILHQRKLVLLKESKKSLLQKMFPNDGAKVPEIRFVGYTDAWEQRKFGELCSIVTKQTGFDYTAKIKNSLLTEASEDTIPYLQTKNFTGISVNYNTDYYIPKTVAKEFPKINLDEKCILFSIVGASVGNIGLFPGDRHCFLSGAICVSKLINENDVDYLYHYMCSESGQSQIRTCTKGGAQATITIEDIRNFDVKLPSKEERSEIGRLLTSIDDLITLHQHELISLENLKKTLLQQMFI